MPTSSMPWDQKFPRVPKQNYAAPQHMTELEQSPERIKAFFQDKHVRYAS